ncbi:hypothetical protein NDU88_004846 [Pleurodeles waltl]|uniref:Uncharacterized protein n=1 Tax=Pleurodeles waltl TaxID=8319 RepID=A0AAV7QD53_PLEWA|nr:hypothetical protein NDU88_004846 [Pleurodeles waltl]
MMNSMPGRRCDQDVRSALCGQGSGRTGTLLQYAMHAERGRLLSVSWPGWGSESRVPTATQCQARGISLATTDTLLSGRVWGPQVPTLTDRTQARRGAQAPRARSSANRALPFWVQAGKQLRRPRAAATLNGGGGVAPRRTRHHRVNVPPGEISSERAPGYGPPKRHGKSRRSPSGQRRVTAERRRSRPASSGSTQPRSWASAQRHGSSLTVQRAATVSGTKPPLQVWVLGS